MDIKIIVGILLTVVFAVGVGLLIPGGDASHEQSMPWQIEETTGGSTRVLGLVLGVSTLQEAEQEFQAEAEISLFDVPDREPEVEAYFDMVTRNGLSAKIVLVVELDVAQRQAMFQRGTRISHLGDGRHKVTLQAEDLALVRQAPVISLTYLPRVRLPQAIIERRFGQPPQRLTEADSDTVHLLYPQFGLDIALNEKGNTVLQYVQPQRFSQLLDALQ
jgi:hypothetical protein